jgi:NHL repeat
LNVAAAIRVSLASTLKRPALPKSIAAPLLDLRGPLVCIGGTCGSDGLAVPVTPSDVSLFGPRGACLIGERGPLWVCDTGHHRLLGWARPPTADDTAADWVVGQPDFSHEGRNAKGFAGAATLNVPTGITHCGEGLAVADAWNHRVLIWRALPRRHNEPADVVLGQPDFASVDSNQGSRSPSAASLFWPYGVHWDGARLWVADTGNRRVLMWNGLPEIDGEPAHRVLGQRDFDCRDENGGGEPSPTSMRWPHGIAIWGQRLCVADAGNNRVMIWNTIPDRNNAPCDQMLGQNDFRGVDHNQSLYWPTSGGLNMPYGIVSAGKRLIVADTANSRLLAWTANELQTGAPADALTGQDDFQAKGDNRWQLPTRDSLCWPYGISCGNGLVVVCDSGNNRIMLWRLAQSFAS